MAEDSKLKVLIVDDSVLYRKVLSDILLTFPDVEVIGSASNGKIALEKISKLKPDFITLDFEMPEMDGLQTLKALKKDFPQVFAVMVSAHTKDGAEVTMQALEEGAFDFIAKPTTGGISESQRQIKGQLRPIVNTMVLKKTLYKNKPLTNIRQDLNKLAAPVPAPSKPFSQETVTTDISRRMSSIIRRGKCEVVGLGISTGGPNALTHVIPRLPQSFKVPMLIVQHMPPVFTAALAESLNKKSAVTVVEGVDGTVIMPGTVYIAPGGKQMKIERDENSKAVRLKITDDMPENNCRPSVDYLFRSIAEVYGGNSLGVIMTGMGADGVKGLAVLKKLGTKVIAQDEATCTVFGMPMEAIKACVVDVVAPLDNIADEIASSLR